MSLSKKNFGIYIHIPFCKQACHYCDFFFSTNIKLKSKIIECINKELVMRKEYVGNASISSIYFGGGTPSLLSLPEISSILNTILREYTCNPNIEVTLEANPDDLKKDKFKQLNLIGINRLSIGIQSFQDDILRYMNRSHDSKTALNSIEIARKVGFQTFSIDLMYAIPGLNLKLWSQDLSTAISYMPDHISAYCLTIEKNTVFGKWKLQNKFTAESEENTIEQFKMLVQTLEKHGYKHYEISNFCLSGKIAIHNTNYWKQIGYLGIGPSAHSYNGNSRQYNLSNNKKYIDEISNNKIPATIEILNKDMKIKEYIMTSLRTSWGCDMNYIKDCYDYDLENISKAYIKLLLKLKIAVIRDGIITLTLKGKLLVDQVSKDIFKLI